MRPNHACAACGDTGDKVLAEHAGKWIFDECRQCGLQEAVPMPTEPVFETPRDESLSRTERLALAWLAEKGKGPVVILCCGAGRLLAELRERKFQPLGLDPLAANVDSLSGRGFDVRAGMAEAAPSTWPEPSAILLLESLVRFPNPVAVLTEVRKRFPKSMLYVSVPGWRSLMVPAFERRRDYPPDQLTRWTPKALKAAFVRAGYRPQVERRHVDLNVFRGSLRTRFLKAAFALFLRITGESEEAIVGWGTPA
jgi:hypothetical protein